MDVPDREGQVYRLETREDKGTRHWYRYANKVPLNKSNPEGLVNVLDYVETDKKGQRHTWCWVTDIPLNEDTASLIMKGGRSRWHIEKRNFQHPEKPRLQPRTQLRSRQAASGDKYGFADHFGFPRGSDSATVLPAVSEGIGGQASWNPRLPLENDHPPLPVLAD